MHQTTSSSDQYFLQPTGRYTVGYRDFTSKICNFRVYYPSEQKISDRSAYYPKGIKKYQKDIRDCKIEHLTELDIESLHNLTSSAHHKLTPLIQKQPMIYFIPGMEANAPEYENMLCELASHGYIIIGLDNTDDSKKTPQMAFTELKNLDHTLRTNPPKDDLFPIIDFKRVGLLGHSMGAVAAILAGQQDNKLFQAVVALDAPADLEKPIAYDIRKPCKIPSLQFHASTWIQIYSGGSGSYSGSGAFVKARNGYHIVLKNDSDSAIYSDHNNFSDRSTLQYHPVIQAFNRHPPKQKEVKEALIAGIIASPMQVGCGNGVEIAHTINQYLCGFFQTFLLRKPHTLFLTHSGFALPHTHFLSWSTPILPETTANMSLGGVIKPRSHSERKPLLSELENEQNKHRCCCLIL